MGLCFGSSEELAIKTIYFSNSIDGVASLAQCRALKKLTLKLGSSQVSNLEALSKLSNLTQLTLDLRDSRVRDLEPLTKLSNLTQLTIDLRSDPFRLGYNLNVGNIEPLAKLSNLTQLTLYFGPGRIGNLEPLTKLSNLTQLTLGFQICPVSDLESRIRAMGTNYESYFAARYHVGKTLSESPEEYRRRSPVWNVDKLTTPLLIHANTSDDDVPFAEVEKLLQALQASGKSFEQHIYTNAPGGHQFNRLDTPLARESREEIWRFLARQLQPAGSRKAPRF